MPPEEHPDAAWGTDSSSPSSRPAQNDPSSPSSSANDSNSRRPTSLDTLQLVNDLKGFDHI